MSLTKNGDQKIPFQLNNIKGVLAIPGTSSQVKGKVSSRRNSAGSNSASSSSQARRKISPLTTQKIITNHVLNNGNSFRSRSRSGSIGDREKMTFEEKFRLHMMNRFKPKVFPLKNTSPPLQTRKNSNSPVLRSPKIQKVDFNPQDVGRRIQALTGKYKAANSKNSARSGNSSFSATRKPSPIRKIMERLMIPENYHTKRAPEFNQKLV